MSFKKFSEVDTVKLLPVFGHDFVKEAILAHNVVDDEVQGLFGGDGAHWFYFDPIGIIVDDHNGVFYSTLPGRERSY